MSRSFGCVLVGPDFCQRRSGVDPIAKRQIGGRPILEWVVNRLREAQSLDGVIVVAAEDDATTEVADVVATHTAVHISAKSDSLSRVLEAVEDRNVSSLVIVSTDSPLVDPTLVDRLVSTVSADTDYATYCSRSKGGVLNAKLGLLAEWVRVEALRRASSLLTSPIQRDRFCQFMMACPEEFTLKLLKVPVELDRNDVRLALETQDDWAHAEAVVDALGYDLDWKDITQLLERQPRLRQRMADLNNLS